MVASIPPPLDSALFRVAQCTAPPMSPPSLSASDGAHNLNGFSSFNALGNGSSLTSNTREGTVEWMHNRARLAISHAPLTISNGLHK